MREPQANAVHDAPNAVRRWARNLAITAIAGAFLAFTGAFGSMAGPLGRRLTYGIPVMMAGGVLGGVVAGLTEQAPRARDNPWVRGAAITFGVAIPSSAFLWLYTAWFFGFPARWSDAPGFFLTVLAVSAAMTAIMILVNRPGATTHAAPPSSPAAPRFLERLPPKLKGAVLYAVEAEDHYLRLHTSKGQDLLLMRLADAIGELEGVEGAQTHRSWWVARAAVQQVKRDNGRVSLILPDGAAAPVSRPNVRALREAGWI